jgi:hypothetical protein
MPGTLRACPDLCSVCSKSAVNTIIRVGDYLRLLMTEKFDVGIITVVVQGNLILGSIFYWQQCK